VDGCQAGMSVSGGAFKGRQVRSAGTTSWNGRAIPSPALSMPFSLSTSSGLDKIQEQLITEPVHRA
jgi:hypothetical protein